MSIDVECGDVKAGSSSSSRPADEVTNAPHCQASPEVPYTIVIPTMGRWRPACQVNASERALKNVQQPFILVKTLAFLARHGIPKARVWLFVSDATEQQLYAEALKGTAWEGTHIIIGVPGILAQRNFIVKYFNPDEYIVSIDDDVSDVLWKCRPGLDTDTLRSLPHGSFKTLIYDAHRRLRTYKAFICGLNPSDNIMNMRVDGLSTRNGEVNGFLYFFLNRHAEDLLPNVVDATEDAERSLRYFHKDKIILRYRMYCGETRCFDNHGGLQTVYGSFNESTKVINIRRKEVERQSALRLSEMFPDLCAKPREKKAIKSLEVNFRSKGGPVIPSTTVEALRINLDNEKQTQIRRTTSSADMEGEPTGRRNRKKRTSALKLADVGTESILSPHASADQAQGETKRGSKEDEESDSDGEAEIIDEDKQLLEAIQKSKLDGCGTPLDVNEDDLVIQVVMRNINGDFEDPLTEAMRASEAAFEEDQHLRRCETRAIETALVRSMTDYSIGQPAANQNRSLDVRQEDTADLKRQLSVSSTSLSDADSGTIPDSIAESACKRACRSTCQANAQRRSIDSSSSSGSQSQPQPQPLALARQDFISAFKAMGFDLSNEQAEALYRDSHGNMDTALAMFFSLADNNY